MVNLKKLDNFNVEMSQFFGNEVANLIEDMRTYLEEELYVRSEVIPTLIPTPKNVDLLRVTVVNPTIDDINLTVHILSRLYGELQFLSKKVLSSTIRPDFNLRLDLMYAYTKEKQILEMQTKALKERKAQVQATVAKAMPPAA